MFRQPDRLPIPAQRNGEQMSGGIVWAIAAAIGFGLFQALNRKAGQNMDAVRGTFILILVSSVLLIVVALITTEAGVLQTATLSAVFYFSLAGFIHFFIGWTLISISQNQIGAARTGAVLGTMPLFGLAIDILLYHEELKPAVLLGVGLVVAGVFIISYR
jgi:drug/metabolite transporter (DMT)-like permease